MMKGFCNCQHLSRIFHLEGREVHLACLDESFFIDFLITKVVNRNRGTTQVLILIKEFLCVCVIVIIIIIEKEGENFGQTWRRSERKGRRQPACCHTLTHIPIHLPSLMFKLLTQFLSLFGLWLISLQEEGEAIKGKGCSIPFGTQIRILRKDS